MAKQERNEAAKKTGGARRVLCTIGKVVGTMLLTAFLAFLIFSCLFAVYVKNDLSQQAEWAADSFSLDQTSVIYYEDPTTGKYEVLQTLYGVPVAVTQVQAGSRMVCVCTPYAEDN